MAQTSPILLRSGTDTNVVDRERLFGLPNKPESIVYFFHISLTIPCFRFSFHEDNTRPIDEKVDAERHSRARFLFLLFAPVRRTPTRYKAQTDILVSCFEILCSFRTAQVVFDDPVQ